MRKVGLHRLYKWRPSARFGCLGVFVFCGILSACPIAAIWDANTWREPSYETRLKVNADLRSCTLDALEFPNGWSKDWPMAWPIYQKPVPTGMLGGIVTPFSRQGSRSGMPAFHELRFYERTFDAVYYYKIRRFGYIFSWGLKWLPIDLSQANLSADEFRAKCSEFVVDIGPGRGEGSCETKARYGRFVSVFHSDISPRDMSMHEYIQVLQAFDRRMLQCAHSFADKRWE